MIKIRIDYYAINHLISVNNKANLTHAIRIFINARSIHLQITCPRGSSENLSDLKYLTSLVIITS